MGYPPVVVGSRVASGTRDDPTTWVNRFLGDMEYSEGDPTASAADRTSRSTAPERIGRFHVTATLGEGGMGIVYAAVDPVLERRVAVKVIRRALAGDAVARERFRREARVVADIADPHVCRVYEVGEDNGQLFIVMELLEGEPLEALLQRGPLPFAQAVSMVLEVLAALASLHHRGIIHRDLKPSNVFLTREGAKLVDFGLARQTADVAETGRDVTAAGVILGTPRYMAPEQLRGQPAETRTDLFAAGALFYELLSGRPAFDTHSLLDAMQRILIEEPPLLSGPAGVEAANRIIQRSLSRDPHGRHPSAAAMADDVRALLVYCADEGPSIVSEVRAPATSIAVLPFVGIGAHPDNEDFADGMTEEVIAQLSKIRAVRVIARASVMGFKKREQTPREIGARLGVRALLDGSIRRAGTRVRIVAQLLDAATETYLWSETYDRELTDIFNIQGEVALQITQALEAEMTSGERARLGRQPTKNLAAYHLYLKGRHCLLKYTADGVRQGLGFLTQAVREDPQFGLACAWISLAHVMSGMGYDGGLVLPDAAYRSAREAGERALLLDSELGEAHGALAFVKLVMDFDWSGSELGFRRALELNPNSDLMWGEYGLLLSALGRYEEAIAAYRRAKELNPLTAVHSSTLASILLRAGRADEALDEAAQLVVLQPEFPLAHSNLGWAHLMRGALDQGLAELETAVSLAPGNTMLLGQLGHALALAGRIESAGDILTRLKALATTRYVSPYHLAYVHAGLRQDDAAMDCLERGYDERAGGIYGMKGSFLFVSLRSHPRFNALLRKMNLEPG